MAMYLENHVFIVSVRWILIHYDLPQEKGCLSDFNITVPSRNYFVQIISFIVKCENNK